MLRIAAVQLGQNKATVLADKHVVKIYLAPAVLRSLYINQIPVNGGIIAVVRFVLCLPRRKMYASCDLFVKQGVQHGFVDIRVYTEGKLAYIACAFISVQDFV